MIFSLQFSEETGYCDNIQQMTGARDTYDGWTEIKPSADFVDYYKNADGSDFKWSEAGEGKQQHWREHRAAKALNLTEHFHILFSQFCK